MQLFIQVIDKCFYGCMCNIKKITGKFHLGQKQKGRWWPCPGGSSVKGSGEVIRASASYTSGWGSFVLFKMDHVRVVRAGGSLSMLHQPLSDPSVWDSKIEHFGPVYRFQICFASLGSAYYFFNILLFFIIQIQKFSQPCFARHIISHLIQIESRSLSFWS